MALQPGLKFFFGSTFLLALSLATVAMWASPATAAFIVKDTWQDSDRTAPASPVYSEYGVDGDSDTDLESAWYTGGTGATLTATPNKLTMDVAATSASWTTFFTPEATPVSLANSGDFLKVQWVFKTGDVNASNTSQNMRLAVVRTPVGSRITTDAAPNNAAYNGGAYSMFMNMGETTGATNSFQLKKRSLLTSSDILGTSGNWGTNLANGLGNTQIGYADNTQYTYTMTLTRNGANGLDIVSTMAGGNIGGTGLVTAMATDAAPNGFSFDTFTLRPSGDASTSTLFDASLFSVETNTVSLVSPPVVTDFEDTASLNETIATVLTATNGPNTWGPLTNPTYVPDYGAEPDGLGAFFSPNWNPLTQQFSWNTQGSSRGHYTWDVAATNPGGSDTGKITIHVPFVPEPTSLVLIGLAMVGVAGSVRRRS